MSDLALTLTFTGLIIAGLFLFTVLSARKAVREILNDPVRQQLVENVKFAQIAENYKRG